MSQKNGSSINFIVCLNLTDVNRRFYSIRFDISVEFYRLSGKKNGRANKYLVFLLDRLRKARWFESVEETKFHFGIKPEYMKSIQEYWLNEYE